jgi:hypothetical protein
VSHPIPLHTADRLERTFEALSQRVESSGDEGWVMRILAMLICRCLDHFVAMIEDLLAQIRAGTIVLPAWAYESSANPAQGQQNPRGRVRAPPSRVDDPSTVRAARRTRTSRDPQPRDPGDAAASAPERSAGLAPGHPGLTRSPPRPHIRRLEHGPRGVAGYPCAVPRPHFAGIGARGAALSLGHFVTISQRNTAAHDARGQEQFVLFRGAQKRVASPDAPNRCLTVSPPQEPPHCPTAPSQLRPRPRIR